MPWLSREAFLGQRHAEHQTDAPALEVKDLLFRYNGRVALEQVSFRVEAGERVAVVGPNGAGKSTLFKIVAGVLSPTSGAVSIFGCRPGGHLCIAYVVQGSRVDWSFPVTVFDVVMMGRTALIGVGRLPSAGDRAAVRRCLETVGLQDLADRQIGELSGGQQQRMFIARALAQEAAIMLMDEPLAGLDVTSQEDLFRLLDELRRRKVTVLVATHDLNLAADRFDRVMLLNGRLFGFGTAPEIFTPGKLKDAYGAGLRLLQSEKGLTVISDITCEAGEDAHE